MSIFISELAFEDPAVKAQAKLAILIASTVAGVVGMLVIKTLLERREISEKLYIFSIQNVNLYDRDIHSGRSDSNDQNHLV